MDNFPPTKARSLKKAQTLNARGFEVLAQSERIRTLEQELFGFESTSQSFAQRNQVNAERPGEHSNLHRTNSQFATFVNNDFNSRFDTSRDGNDFRVLRTTASTSRIPKQPNAAVNSVIDSLNELNFANTPLPGAETLDQDIAQRRRNMHKTQSMRFPPGFKQTPPSAMDFNTPGVGFPNRKINDSRELKRFVTFTGKPRLQETLSGFSFQDEFSDDEDVNVSVVDELTFDFQSQAKASNINIANAPPVATSEVHLKRIDSRQKMRKAFPRTMFDNRDDDVANDDDLNGQKTKVSPLMHRINSAASMRSNASTSTSTSHSISPRRLNKSKSFLKSNLSMSQSPPGDAPNQQNFYENNNQFSPQVQPNYHQRMSSPQAHYANMGFQMSPQVGPTTPNGTLFGYDGRSSPMMNMNMNVMNPNRAFNEPNMYDSNAVEQNRALMDLMLKQQNMIHSLQQQQQQQYGYSGYNNNFYPQNRTPPMNHRKDNQNGSNQAYGDRNLSGLLIRHKTSGYRPSLPEIFGHVVEFSRDSHGSRLVQCLMEAATQTERERLTDEVLPQAVSLMQDLFGNYVMQNFLEHCSITQRNYLAEEIRKAMNLLSFQPHGCRVVQRAIDILESEKRNELLKEVISSDDKIRRCGKDPHATHVLQKAVILLQKEINLSELNENLINENKDILEKIERSISSDVLQLAVHPHACRLVQKTLGDCNYDRSEYVESMMEEIRKVFPMLAVDQHGNFILQHILDKGNEIQKQEVQSYVSGRFLELAQHKFGSHLVEKCLNVANRNQAEKLVTELLKPAIEFKKRKEQLLGNIDEKQDMLLTLMKDPYANFVVQRAFDASRGIQRQHLVNEVQSRAEILSRFTYGRHILSHVNRT